MHYGDIANCATSCSMSGTGKYLHTGTDDDAFRNGNNLFFRAILAACSPYFRAMFTGELAESRQTEVTIRDIDETAMDLLIDFCYTSHIVVEEGNVQTLLPAGNWVRNKNS